VNEYLFTLCLLSTIVGWTTEERDEVLTFLQPAKTWPTLSRATESK
jgi:hypothetical protein